MKKFELQILGSGSAIPTDQRSLTAQILTAHNEPYLIDCGEGTQIQMRRFDVKSSKINNIFISHLHGDHFFGLFGLLSTFNLQGRIKPLNIHADKELEKILKSEHSPLDIKELKFDIIFHHLPDETKIIFENNYISVKSFMLKHRIITRGFLFQEKEQQPNIIKEKISELNLSVEQILDLKNKKDILVDGKKISYKKLTTIKNKLRSFAFCSDTAFKEDIIPIIKDVDLIYHESTFSEKDATFAEKTSHSTAADAANMAKLSNAKKLVIGHFSSRYTRLNFILDEAKDVFPNTVLAFDGLKVEF